MVWNNRKNSFILKEGKRSLATIITPFWTNNNKRQPAENIKERNEAEDPPTKQEVRDKSFELTHPPSQHVFEIAIKDSTGTFVSSFDLSEERTAPRSTKSRKSFSDKSFVNKYISRRLSIVPSVDIETDSLTEGSSESITKSNPLPISRSFSFESLKSVSNKSQGCGCLESVSNKSVKSISEASLSSVATKRRKLPSSLDTVVKTPTETALNTLKEDPRIEQHQKVLALFQRLDEFHKNGCLTQQDYEHYHKLLKKYRSNYYVRKINTYLDQIAKRELRDVKASIEARKLLDKEQDTDSIMAETMSGQKKGRVSWGSNQIQSLSIEFSDEESKHSIKEKHTRSEVREANHAILEPEDLWSGNIDFDEHQLQELFVEMCFFARLGYAQPPCCLKCTYKETKGQDTVVKDRSSPPGNPSCRRWVVWRKNADTLLHPNKLDGNILIMQCHVAQKLLDGKVVGGRRWNAEQRRVTTLSTA